MPIRHSTTTTSARIGAGTYDRHHAAVIRPLRLVGRSSAQFALVAYSAAIGSWDGLRDVFGTVAT